MKIPLFTLWPDAWATAFCFSLISQERGCRGKCLRPLVQPSNRTASPAEPQGDSVPQPGDSFPQIAPCICAARHQGLRRPGSGTSSHRRGSSAPSTFPGMLKTQFS